MTHYALSCVCQFCIVLLSCFTFRAYAAEPAPQFSLPIDCQLGVNCFIQNYVDADASAAYSDYHCGFLSYDGHRGTDFRPKDANIFAANSAVLAAAAGYVRAVRDGMSDVSVRVQGAASVKNREAGNSVVIVHSKDWESQVAHLKNGSVAVRVGQYVKRGDLLGFVGLSGNTEFEHLHFEVRYQGKPVDPFIGLQPADNCAVGKQALWTAQALAALNYIPSAVWALGVTDHALIADEPLVASNTLTADAAALVFWVQTLGLQAGDAQRFIITAPDGKVLIEKSLPVARTMAQNRSFVGIPRRQANWTKGTYRLSYQLLRAGDIVVSGQLAALLGASD